MVLRKGHAKSFAFRRAGFTLVEVLIVISILIVVSMAMISGLNPIMQVNRGKDAVRKKDLKRISVAFEEYYSDKGCYPTQEIIDGLNSVGCGTTGLYQLNPWPCDPNKTHYQIKVAPAAGCPNTFWVTTRLEAEKATTVCNYGVASANKSWQDDSCFEESLETGGVGSTAAPPIATPTATPTPCSPLIGQCFRNASEGATCNNIGLAVCHVGERCFSDGDCKIPVCGCNY